MNETINKIDTDKAESSVPGLKFWERNKEEIKDACRPFIEKFTREECDKILFRLHKYDGVKPAGNALYLILSDILDIDPEMRYEDSFEKKPHSFYNTKENTVHIRTSISDLNMDKNEFALKTFNKIAHEMFHAYQYKVANSDEARADLYRREFYNYKTSETDCENGYASQFLEMEAMFFGYNIEMKMSDAIDQK